MIQPGALKLPEVPKLWPRLLLYLRLTWPMPNGIDVRLMTLLEPLRLNEGLVWDCDRLSDLEGPSKSEASLPYVKAEDIVVVRVNGPIPPYSSSWRSSICSLVGISSGPSRPAASASPSSAWALNRSSSSSASSSSLTWSSSPPKPSPSTRNHTGMAAMIPTAVNVHHGAMTYPASTPALNSQPPMNGPAARPRALKDVANPLSVPSTLRLVAELVSRIVEQGKANIDAQHLINRTAKRPIIWVSRVGSRAVNGIRKLAIGNAIAQAFRQLRTPVPQDQQTYLIHFSSNTEAISMLRRVVKLLSTPAGNAFLSNPKENQIARS
jgi:hypothetical protein